MDYTIYNGDCLKEFKKIQGASVDLVLVDPPYGIMAKHQNASKDKAGMSQKKYKEKLSWDHALDIKTMMRECARILRPNGKAIIFSQEPYTSELVLQENTDLTFCYPMYWKKNNAGFYLGCKKNCVSFVEVMCLFRRIPYGDEIYKDTSIRKYLKDELEKSGLTISDANKLIGTKSMASHYFGNGRQFAIPSEKHYRILQSTGYFQKPYSVLKNAAKKYYKSTFNLNGANSKSNVFEYAKEGTSFHPTQKPTLLLEDLIKTFSDEGDLVLDFTMGSGSTGVACGNTNRKFIGIEKDENYYKIAESRINEAYLNAKKKKGG